MKTSTISQFKAHISENLRDVRAGEHFIIMDRNTAVAEVSPVFGTRSPVETLPRKTFSIPAPPTLSVSRDAAELLAEERGTV